MSFIYFKAKFTLLYNATCTYTFNMHIHLKIKVP